MATVVIQKRNRNGKKSYPVHYKDPVTFKSVHYNTFKKYKDILDYQSRILQEF